MFHVSDILPHCTDRILHVEKERTELIKILGRKEAFQQHLKWHMDFGRQSGHTVAAITLWLLLTSTGRQAFYTTYNLNMLQGGKDILRQIQRGELISPRSSEPVCSYDWRKIFENNAITPGTFEANWRECAMIHRNACKIPAGAIAIVDSVCFMTPRMMADLFECDPTMVICFQ